MEAMQVHGVTFHHKNSAVHITKPCFEDGKNPFDMYCLYHSTINMLEHMRKSSTSQ